MLSSPSSRRKDEEKRMVTRDGVREVQSLKVKKENESKLLPEHFL